MLYSYTYILLPSALITIVVTVVLIVRSLYSSSDHQLWQRTAFHKVALSLLMRMSSLSVLPDPQLATSVDIQSCTFWCIKCIQNQVSLHNLNLAIAIIIFCILCLHFNKSNLVLSWWNLPTVFSSSSDVRYRLYSEFTRTVSMDIQKFCTKFEPNVPAKVFN